MRPPVPVPMVALLCLAAWCALLVGCRSGGGGPLEPLGATLDAPGVLRVPDVPLLPIQQSANTALIPLGRYRLTLDPDTAPVLTWLPTRSTAALGDRFALDITRAIAGGFGGGKTLQATGFDRLGTDRIQVSLRVTHPFGLPNLADPASPTNRLDLHLFGVHAVVLSAAAGIDPSAGSVPGLLVDPDLITNPMGYTATFPRTITGTATTVQPYRMFLRDDPLVDATNLGMGNFDEATGFADLLNPIGYNVFPQGGSATTDLIFPVTPGTPRTVDLLIGAYWVDATADDALDLLPRTDGGPRYFAPAGAGSAAWWVSAAVTTHDLMPAEATGTVDVNIRLLDWQFNKTTDPAYPDPANLGGLPETSQPQSVRVVIPALNASAIDLSAPTNAGTATGFFDAPLSFDATIPNTLGAVGGTYLGVVAITDSATPGTQAEGNPTLTLSGKRILGERFDVPSTATVQLIRVVVPAGTIAPTVELMSESPVTVGTDLSLTVSGCDPDGAITEFQWDFAFDGTFEVQRTDPPGTGNTVTLTIGAPFACVPTAQPLTIAVRALDNDGHFSEIICTPPAEGSTFDPGTCTAVGDPPQSCFTLEILPRDSAPMFATEVNASGAPASNIPFTDTRTSGQHGLVISPNGRQVWVVYHQIRGAFETGNAFIVRSENSGATFGTPINLSLITPEMPATPGEPAPPGELALNPAIALQENASGLHPVVVYARGLDLDQNIALRIATDAGDTFGPEIRFLRPGNQGQPGVVMHGSTDAYFTFVDFDQPGGDRIMVGRGRLDAPEIGFVSINDIANDTGATVRYRTNYLVSQTAPALVLDPILQRLYVTWSDAARVGNNRARIMLDSTALGALDFGPDVAVGPLPAVGTYQFEPSPVRNPVSGKLQIAYRTSRVETSQLVGDVLVATQSGAGFGAPIQVSDAASAPRLAFAPSLTAAPGGELFVVWQGAPTGDSANYDIFLDQSSNGLVWGTDVATIDDEAMVEGELRPEQALNPMSATTGCDLYIGWTGPANPMDANNTYAVYVDVGS